MGSVYAKLWNIFQTPPKKLYLKTLIIQSVMLIIKFEQLMKVQTESYILDIFILFLIIKSCSDNVFLLVNLKVNITLVPLTKT